jgi:hypothetical protein
VPAVRSASARARQPTAAGEDRNWGAEEAERQQEGDGRFREDRSYEPMELIQGAD